MIGGLYGIRRKELTRLGDQLLEQFSIAEAADRVVKSYSGGMRRRLDLAVSLLTSPGPSSRCSKCRGSQGRPCSPTEGWR